MVITQCSTSSKNPKNIIMVNISLLMNNAIILDIANETSNKMASLYISFSVPNLSPVNIRIMYHQVPADFKFHSSVVWIVIDCSDTSTLVKETDADHS